MRLDADLLDIFLSQHGLCHSGPVVACPSAVREDPGLNPTADGCV